MSSKKEERKEVPSRSFSEVPELTTAEEHFAEYRDNINKALDETKANIKKSIDETRTQIPRYTNAINEYQEQVFQTAKEIADNYVDSQREIIVSSESTLSPYIEGAQRIANYWTPSPRALAGAYVGAVSNYADNIITTTRLVNNMMFANVEACKTTLQQAADNSKELLKVGINTARTVVVASMLFQIQE
ncbi:MAG: hypothetical protein WBP64_04270 [Nitrososphaeraceae archaeon]